MLSIFKQKISLPFFQLTHKNFAQKQNLRRFKKLVETPRLKDFTNSFSVTSAINKKMDNVRSELPFTKFSKTIRRHPKELKFSPVIDLPKEKRVFNQFLRKEVINVVKAKEDEYDIILESRLFNKDHTAAVLENVRKGIENKVFNKKLHYLREKGLAMKIAKRKKKYLILNYNEKFLNYENYNDTKNFQNHHAKSLNEFTYDILPDLPFKKTPQIITNISNKLIDYENNKNILINNRIDSILKIKNSNPILQNLLLSEGSTEIVLNEENKEIIKKNELFDSNNLQVSEEKNIEYFDNEMSILKQIDNFELEEYAQWKDIDLFHKHGGRVEFKDMTLQENLNYVKFYIKNSLELFKMFGELKKKESSKNEDNNFLIYSFILHKLAFSIKNYKNFDKIIHFSEYKSLLQNIKPHFTKLDNKNLIDTLWSIGQIHSYKREFSPKFFSHFISELFTEIKERVEYLDVNEIAFLCEGLRNLKCRSETEMEISNLVYDRVVKLKDNLTFLQISKIINYYHVNNHSNLSDLLIELGESLMRYITEYMHLIRDDLNYKDIISVIDAYSYVKSRNRLDAFFLTERDFSSLEKALSPEEYANNKELLVKNNESTQLLKSKLEEIDKYTEFLLKTLSFPIIAMRKELLIKQASKLLSIYSNSNIFVKDVFLYAEKQLNDLIEVGHPFDIVDVMHTTWGLSKYYTNKIFPDFNLDANLIIYPSFHEKLNSIKFITIQMFADKIFEKKNFLNPKYLSLICYNLSLLGYSNLDFYLPIYHNLKLVCREKPIKKEETTYLLQALSMLNYNDNDLVSFLVINFINKCENFSNFTEDFSLAQFCSSAVMLNSKKVIKSLRFWETFIEALGNYTAACYTVNHLHYYISIMWFMTYFDSVKERHFLRFLNTIDELKSPNYLTKYDKIILAQVFLSNNNYLPLGFDNEYKSDLLKFEKEKIEIQKKISVEMNQKYIGPIITSLITKNNNYFNAKGLVFKFNFIVDDSYLVPIFSDSKKVCVLLYNHTEILKDRSVSGYNIIKESYLMSKGYSICRIYQKEFSDLLQLNYNDDKKVLEWIVDKIKSTEKIKRIIN